MMKHLNDEQLEVSADRARSNERKALHEMLMHLKEIDRRYLYSKRGYPSIYDYAMNRFKYTYDEIHRRYAAARVLKEMPEIESKIIDGSLHLTHLTQAQSYFKKVQHTKTEKLEILAKLENTTKAETKKILYNEESNTRYYFEANKAFEVKVERLKGLHPHLNFDRLMEKVCDLALEKLDPAVKAERINSKVKNKAELLLTNEIRTGAKVQSRYIPAVTKREVWLKADGKCENCKSTFALEYDHIVPFAKGGANLSTNLQLLCRSCNQRKGIEQYGLRKIEENRFHC